MFIARGAGAVPSFLHPLDWHLGDEGALTHALVEAEPAAVEQLWSIQKDVRSLAEFVVEREGPRLQGALEKREVVDEATFADITSFLDAEVPRLRPLWSRLDRLAVPSWPWQELTRYVARWRSLSRFRTAETEAVFHHHALPNHLLLLLDPTLATFGAGYDDRKTLLQAAVLTLAREPLRDLGLRERAHGLNARARTLLSRRATRQAFVGKDTFWVVRPADATALGRRVTTLAEDEDETDHLRELEEAFARVDGTFLMTLTRWRDFDWSFGQPLELEQGGMWRIVPYQAPPRPTRRRRSRR